MPNPLKAVGSLLGSTVKSPIEAIGGAIDAVFTSDEERLDKKEIMARLAQNPSKWQAEINTLEAQHRSVFVAGWRPFIGWVCGSALAYQFVVRDLIFWTVLRFNADAAAPPDLEMSALVTILTGMIGLASLRTVEKSKGVAK